jgi:hypothetical protein
MRAALLQTQYTALLQTPGGCSHKKEQPDNVKTNFLSANALLAFSDMARLLAIGLFHLMLYSFL